MAKISTSISIEADIKERAVAMLNDFGLDLSTAVGIFLRQMLRERKFPLEMSLNVPNAVTLAAMDAAETGDDMHGPFDSVSALMEALNA